ncbi:MAG: hypothetical protein HY906_02530 [Deltaproteobacteria bacterium]|nr:hypothetical protein [Deltaproteobacteria bacterium]
MALEPKKAFQYALVLIMVGSVAWALFYPGAYFTPDTRGILYLFASAVVATFIATTAATKLKWSGLGFSVTAVGAAAVLLAVFFALQHYTKPKHEVTIYEVFDSNERPVSLEPRGALEVGRAGGAPLKPDHCAQGHELFLVFPQQAPRAGSC